MACARGSRRSTLPPEWFSPLARLLSLAPQEVGSNRGRSLRKHHPQGCRFRVGPGISGPLADVCGKTHQAATCQEAHQAISAVQGGCCVSKPRAISTPKARGLPTGVFHRRQSRTRHECRATRQRASRCAVLPAAQRERQSSRGKLSLRNPSSSYPFDEGRGPIQFSVHALYPVRG
jgi:hypothetical protein